MCRNSGGIEINLDLQLGLIFNLLSECHEMCMPIDVAEVGSKLVRLLHEILSFWERVNRNFVSRADNASNNNLANLIPIVHATNFFIDTKMR